MELKDLIPGYEKRPSEIDMPQRVWETYCILVYICNSLNALSHAKDPYTQALMLKAQTAITILLRETGRLDELDEWDKKHATCLMNGIKSI